MIPIEKVYILLALTLVTLLIQAYVIKKNKKVLKHNKEKCKNKFIKFIVNKLDLNSNTKRVVDHYTNKLCVINTKNNRDNKYVVVSYMLFVVAASIIIGVIINRILALYMTVAFAFANAFFLFYIANTIINIKIRKIHIQFLPALQSFTDKYIVTKNIAVTLRECYKGMPFNISKSFENLNRNFNTKNYRDVFDTFAKGVDLIWCYAFVEVLKLSLECSGDISSELITLCELTSEEMLQEEQTLTAISESKNVFTVLNVITIVAFIINLVFCKNAFELYFYSANGNNIILYWLASIIICLLSMNILKKI